MSTNNAIYYRKIGARWWYLYQPCVDNEITDEEFQERGNWSLSLDTCLLCCHILAKEHEVEYGICEG